MERQLPTNRPELLQQARQGDVDSLGALLASLRNYLKRLASVQHDRNLRKKIDTSDVLQETEYQAVKDFPDFKGQEIGEFVNWLREILTTKRLKAARTYLTKKRDMTLEQELDVGLHESTQNLVSLVPGDDTSPLDQAMQRELELRVSDVLDQLPASQREVVELHHMKQLTLREVSEQLGKSENAIQKLWARALAKLSKLLKDTP